MTSAAVSPVQGLSIGGRPGRYGLISVWGEWAVFGSRRGQNRCLSPWLDCKFSYLMSIPFSPPDFAPTRIGLYVADSNGPAQIHSMELNVRNLTVG